ncbi:MAG: alpha/beta fold hydrolase [Endozoicomonas sp.]
MKLYARQQGEGADLISVHGLFGSQENLGAINRKLSEQFRVHGLDVRNHGRSPHSEEMNYSAMAADIIEYMDSMKLEQACLLGHSMGGKIVMETALRYPERVGKLAVMDIAPVRYLERRHDEIFDGLFSLDLSRVKNRSEADRALQAYVQETSIRQFLLKNLYRSDNGGFAWRMNLAVIHRHYQDILDGQHSSTSFQGEVLFLKGGDSDYMQPSHRDEVLSLFPNASVRIITGTGHWLHAEKPELVSGALLRFFLS